MSVVKDYRDLIVWQKAMDLVETISSQLSFMPFLFRVGRLRFCPEGVRLESPGRSPGKADGAGISKGPTDRNPLTGGVGVSRAIVTARWALDRGGVGPLPRALPWAFELSPFGASGDRRCPRQLLLEAYAKRAGFKATDEAQLVERIGHAVAVVPGSVMNMKITTKEDQRLVEQVLKALPKPKLPGMGNPFSDDDKWR
jgi:hypothetical protein